MSWWKQLRSTLRPSRMDADIAEEIEHHLRLRCSEPARGRFGNPERVREATHDADVLTWLESWLQDLRHALRLLRRAPGFTLVVVASLAIGIGANAAIFSLINTVLLKTLPVPQPQQIYFLQAGGNGNIQLPVFSYPVFRQMQKAAAGQAELGAGNPVAQMSMEDRGVRARAVAAQLVSGSYFSTLGIEPLRGRWINAQDNRAAQAAPVAVISYGFWQQQFGGAAGVLGRTIQLHKVALRIVGIAPPGFTGLQPADPVAVWVPLMMQPALHASGNRWNFNADDDKPWAPQEGEMWLQVFARVQQPGRTAALAEAFDPLLTASLHRIAPDMHLGYRVSLQPGGRGRDQLRSAYGAPLQLLMVLAGLMLLIAIANVATLLLARVVKRRREIAIRLAVGISRGRLVRQLLTEGVLLAAFAALAAVGLALWLSHFLAVLAGGGSAPFQPDLDWRVWALLAALSLGAGILIGLVQAWQAQRGNTAGALKAEGSQSSGSGRLPLGRGLILAQMAFSLLLVAAAGLFARSLAGMFTRNLGFARAHILTVGFGLPLGDLPAAQLVQLDQREMERVATLPGVGAVAFEQAGLDDHSADTSGVYFPNQASRGTQLHSQENTVTRGYFGTIGMPLLRGRGFLGSDTARSRTVVIVNQAFAQRFYRGQDPVGKTFGYGPSQTSQFEIVGVAADARVNDLHAAAVPLFYRLLAQSNHRALKLEVHTTGAPDALAASVRTAADAVDPRLQVLTISSVNDRLAGMLSRDRLIAKLSGGFGLLALALACLGVYGVVNYTVAARRSEFGLRMALGATRGDVLALVLRETVRLLALGLAAGLALALVAGHWLQPLLPGIAAGDPRTLAAAVAVMGALPLLAAVLPAWRAARTDPARTVRV